MPQEEEWNTGRRVPGVEIRTVLLAGVVGAALALAFWPLLRAQPSEASGAAQAPLVAAAADAFEAAALESAPQLPPRIWRDDYAQITRATVLGLPVLLFDPEAHADLLPIPEVISGVLGSGDSLAGYLALRGVDPVTVLTIEREMRPLYDFQRAQPGQRFELYLDTDGTPIRFRYVASVRESYRLERIQGGFHVMREEVPLIRRRAKLAGIVTSTLYDSIRDLGESPQLAADFTAIFAWDVDFSRAVRPGDEFRILYERNYLKQSDGREVYHGPGRILAARYRGSANDLTAVYYEASPDRGGYYRPDGSSVKRKFLAAPLKYSRISSSYTHARFHPILKINRPHYGIDYAAPAGTPVWSVANGTVIHKGWSRGFGRLVKVRHSDGYVSYYSHLSRYAPGLKVGQRVQQQEQLGFVGSSGLATGPHVCFRIQKNGAYVNPSRLRSPAGDPIPADQSEIFAAVRDQRLSELGPGTLVATEEAL